MRFWCGLLLLMISGLVQAEAEGEVITISTPMGTSLQGYVAGPEDARLGVLVLHDRWGINDTVRDWVHRYASKGYRALAIDVFDGRISDKRWLADEILNATDPEWVKEDLLGGLNFLKAPGRKIVTLGAGFGGWQSFQAALKAPIEVDATIVIYGQLEDDIAAVRTLKAPVLAFFARRDEVVTAEKIEKYRIAMKKSFINYRPQFVDADSGYMDPLYPAYDEALAEETLRDIDNFIAAINE